MAKSQLTFKKKERQKKQEQKRQEKLEKRETNKLNNDKGKALEEMFAYVDEFGNISDTPPTKAYVFNEKHLERPADQEDEFQFGKVSYYNEMGRYGFIRDNESKESVYFNDQIVGFKMELDQKVMYKFIRSRQGKQVSELTLV